MAEVCLCGNNQLQVILKTSKQKVLYPKFKLRYYTISVFRLHKTVELVENMVDYASTACRPLIDTRLVVLGLTDCSHEARQCVLINKGY